MKRFLLALTLMAGGMSTPAVSQDSYCCKTNPSICIAMCGNACCSKEYNKPFSSGQNSSEAVIPIAQLKAELQAAKAARAPAIAKVLQQEIDRRGTTTLKTN